MAERKGGAMRRRASYAQWMTGSVEFAGCAQCGAQLRLAFRHRCGFPARPCDAQLNADGIHEGTVRAICKTLRGGWRCGHDTAEGLEAIYLDPPPPPIDKATVEAVCEMLDERTDRMDRQAGYAGEPVGSATARAVRRHFLEADDEPL